MKPVVLKERKYATWVVFERDDEVKQWVAHDLTTDIMAQAETLEGSQQALLKMISNVLHEAHKRGLDVDEFQQAPPEAWDLRRHVVEQGTPVPGGLAEVPAESNMVIAHYNITWKLTLLTEAPQAGQRPPPRDLVEFQPVPFGKNGTNVLQLAEAC